MNTVNVYHNLIIIQSIGSVDACLSFFFFLLGSMQWDVRVANHGMILMVFFFSLHIPFFSIPFYPYSLFFLCFVCLIWFWHPSILQCDQDQCIQSTKFVLQAAATPLLQSEPSITSEELPLPGKTSISGPCATLTLGQPTPPSSMPNLTSDSGLTDIIPLKDEHEGHQFLTPEEAPSPPGMLPSGSPITHSHTMHVLSLASQDSLHEDSVRGLVKLSSVWTAFLNITPFPGVYTNLCLTGMTLQYHCKAL